MKLLVFSDSHHDVDTMDAITRREQPQMILHLGDHYGDALTLRERYPHIPMHFVKGNADFSYSGEAEHILHIEGHRLYMTHGHLHHVKNSLKTLYLKGRAMAADIVLFGHTHMPLHEEEHGFTLFNPGSCSHVFCGRQTPTYGCITVTPAGYDCRILGALA